MTVSELIETLLDYDGDEKITYYFLKNDTLTNKQIEYINVMHRNAILCNICGRSFFPQSLKFHTPGK